MGKGKTGTTLVAGKAFINYGHDDDSGHAGRLTDHLAQAFGPDCPFIDVVNILPGEDSVRVIKKEIGICDALIAVIGKNWLKDATGARRFDNPHDFVRFEIELAFKRRNLPVIPVLVGGARMPRPDELPR